MPTPATTAILVFGQEVWNWISKPFHADAVRDAGISAGAAGIVAAVGTAATGGLATIPATATTAIAAGAVVAYTRCAECHLGVQPAGYYANLMGYC